MRSVLNWNDGWNFARATWGETNPAEKLTCKEQVTLPHTWYQDGDYHRGDAVYQKVFTEMPEKCAHVFLRFHGVDKICRIYLNGKLAGEHQGAYSIFAVELSQYLKPGQENILTVFVNNENGKAVSPLSGDFTIFGGIHRKVELILTEECHFDCTYYGTCGVIFRALVGEDGKGTILAAPRLCGTEGKDIKIRYTVSDESGKEAAALETDGVAPVSIPVEHPHLWQGKEAPVLYQAAAELYVDGILTDRVVQQTGFRTARLDPEEGFFLNGKHLKLNGVAKHQDTAEVFSAAREEHWDRDMELISEIGANAVRLSHYQHPEYFYDLCDRKGIVVWAEIPLLKLTQEHELLENAKQQLTELILQNIHRPSVCMWGLQNEIAIFGEEPFMYDRMHELQALAKELDPDRLTVSANLNTVEADSPLNRITDAVAYNLYYGWYYGEMDDFDTHLAEFHRVNPGIPLGISEYGVDCNLSFHSAAPKRKDYTEEFQALFHETVYPKLKGCSFVWGTFVWNMFDFVSGVRDEGGVKYRNNKGLVTHDRKTRKDSFYYYKAMWSAEPFVQIAEKRFVNRAEEAVRVKVYSNCAEVTLYVNGTKYREKAKNGAARFADIPLRMGENMVEAAAESCSDQAVFCRTEIPDESYVFVDPNPGIDVQNWFTDEVEREKMFPEDSYSILDTINTLLRNDEVMAIIRQMQPTVEAFMRDTVGTFTLEQGISHAKTLCSEEEVKALNERLITVKKGEEI